MARLRGTRPLHDWVPTEEDLPPRSALPQPETTRPPAHRAAGAPGALRARIPEALVGARWSPSVAAVAGMLVVVVVAVLVFGLRLAAARESGAGDEVTIGGGSRAGPSPSASGTAGPTEADGFATAAAPTRVIVHVVGAVARAGVVELPIGSRVADAVAAAGGATAKADLARVNLARVLVDGEQVHVPIPGEVLTGQPVAGPSTSASGGSPGAKVSLNTADLAALDTLPGVGPVLAQRILDWRSEHSRFTSVEELGEVSGIGEKLLAQLRSKVTL